MGERSCGTGCKLLIAKGADVNAHEQKYGNTPLHGAANKGHVDVANMLIAKGANVNVRDQGGATPLHGAANYGHVAVAELLIAKGADVHAKNQYDDTPLHWAARNGHLDMVKLLIAGGADVYAGRRGSTPIDLADWKGHKDIAELLRQHLYTPAAIEGATGQEPQTDRAANPKNKEALPATSADTPPIKMGDSYIIESQNPDNPKLNNTTERKVISVGKGKITVASKNIKSKTGSARTIQFTPEWNLISSRNPDGSGLDYSPPLKYFEFPLHPGKTWRQTSIEKNSKTGAVREHTLSATVGNWEDVSVPAGTFRAIKITTQTELLDRATRQKSTSTDISWYAPNVRRSVKSEVTSQNFQGNQERQLIQVIRYDLK
jgi:ankyrin repeat protein